MLYRSVSVLLIILSLFICSSPVLASGDPPVFHNPNSPFDDNPVSIAISINEAHASKFVRFIKDEGDVTDPDVGDTLSFSLVVGGDTSKFNIDPVNGDLFTNDFTDFEEPYCSDNTCIVYVKASDGTSSKTQRYDITILDVNEPPAVADQSFDVEEGSLNGTSVGNVVANDPEGDAITYTITSQPTSGLFALDSGNGEITVANESSLDLFPSHTINIQTESTGPLTDTAIITVNVVATTNAAPTEVQVFPDTVPTGTDTSEDYVVGSLRAYDADSSDTHTYTIEGGVDSVKFSISGSELILNDPESVDGKVLFKSPTDSDNDAVYEVLVRATDSGNLNKWVEKTIRVKVVMPLMHTGHTMRSDKWGGDWGTKVLGAKYGEFKCETCHGRKTGNIKRVKGTISTPDGTDWESSLSPDLTVSFQKVSDGDSDFGDDGVAHATSNFICEVCHSQNRFHNYNSAGNLANDHENKADCTRCHQHKNAFRGTGDACNQCHGNTTSKAPTTGAHVVHTNFVTADKDNASFDATDCDLCHSSVLSGDATGSLQYSYDPEADRLNGYNHSDSLGRILELNSSVGYDETDKTCSNACHQSTVSDGYWDDANGLNCDACHYYAALPTAAGNGSNPTPILGKHSYHFASTRTNRDFLCSDCHGTLESQGTGPLSHKHAKDASTDALWLTTQGKDYLNPGGQDVNVDDSAHNAGSGNTWVNSPITTDVGNTCSNTRCHNPSPGASFKADWDETLTPCIGCHGYNDMIIGAPDIVSGSHDAHLNLDPTIGSVGSCGTWACHSGGTHMDGNVDFKAGWTYNSASLNQPAITQDFKSTTWGSCTITDCHQDGTGTPVKSPVWGQDGGEKCNTCHGTTSHGVPQTNAHTAHMQDSTFVLTSWSSAANNSTQTEYQFGCAECHFSTWITWHFRQGNVDMNASVGFNTTTDKCSTSDCHSNGAGSYAETPPWTETWSGDKCAGCHGNSPDTNAHEAHEVGIHYQDIYTGSSGLKTAGNTATSMHGNSNTSTTISCYLCHNGTVTSKANAANVTCDTCHDPAVGDAAIGDEVTMIADKRKHVNRSVEVSFSNIRVRTTAQLRDDISGVGELSSTWMRLDGTDTEDNSGGGYKKDDAYDIFQATKTLDTATMYNSTNVGCTVACHNDYYIEWQPSTSNCMVCHKSLPQ